MKSFFKLVIANLTAIFIVIAGFLTFFVAFILISAISSTPDIKSKSVLTLDFKTKIIDSPSEEEEDFFAMDKEENYVLLYDILQAIATAKDDDKIKGISIETDNISAGISQLHAIREALINFKKSGKFVYAYGNSVSQGAYYLGSVADQYYLHPMGGVMLKGLAAEVTFIKDFADKYGIGFEIIRHGKFKSAVEPYMRNDFSPENEEQMSVLLNDLWGNISNEMSKTRKIPQNQFKTITDSLWAVLPDQSYKYKLVDKLAQKGEYDAMIKKSLGLDKDDKINKLSFATYAESISPKSEKAKVAVLYASGTLYDGRGYKDIYSESFIKEIKKLQQDKSVKAVVLRINSPGGSATASDCILYELQNLKAQKPLIVSFGDYAASGGYYIAMGADKIFSEPYTLTGSIGVFGVIPYFKELTEKNGIHTDVVSTNTNANMISIINGVSPGAVNILTKNVEATYQRFVNFVSKNRKKTFQDIDAIGGGRVWSGLRAKEVGLVDELGSLQDAIAYASQKANLKSYSVESYPAKQSRFERVFMSEEDDDFYAKIIRHKLGNENYKLFQQITSPNTKPNVMMELPFSIKLN